LRGCLSSETAAVEERARYWNHKSLEALRLKQLGRFDEAVTSFCRSIAALDEIRSEVREHPDQALRAQVLSALSAALANLSGVALELTDKEMPYLVDQIAALVTSLNGGPAIPAGTEPPHTFLLLAKHLIQHALHYSIRINRYVYIGRQCERLAAILRALGEYQDVERLELNSLSASLRADDHEVTAKSAMRLAIYYANAGDAAKAISLCELAGMATAKVAIGGSEAMRTKATLHQV
jgi:tetratricopeptide (TPR) repeat protein